MESDDEFNQFVMNDLIDPSSSDDENDLFFDAAHVIVDGLVNHPGRIGSVEGHAVVHRDRLLHHALLYKDYFSDNPTFNSKIFRRRFAMFSIFPISFYIISVLLIFNCIVI